MNEISAARRRELKAQAHHLDPVVAISGNGLSEAVLKEIDSALRAHELIKIRVFGDDREARRQYLEEICARTGAAPVQRIGKLLVVWRERPADQESPAAPRRRPRKAVALTKRAAQTLAEGGGAPKAGKARKPARSAAAPSGKARGRR